MERLAQTAEMEIARARYVVSEEGRAALASLGTAFNAMDVVQLSAALRRTFGAEEAAAVAEQVTLRGRARARFGAAAEGLVLSAEGLEMMTHPLVAERRARRLAALPVPVLDLTCGLGGDLGAVAAAGARAVGMDRDGAMALFAKANAGVDTVVGDAARPPFELAGAAIVIDPARRGAAGRRFDPASYSPDWDTAMRLLGEAAAGVLKTAPGIPHEQIPDDCELEFVQVGRTLREAAVWRGEGAVAGLRRAVLLPADATLDSTEPEGPAELRNPGAFLFDSESCVTRAGLVRHLGARLGARLMDSQVAYLTADEAAFDPLAATFEVLDVVPFSVARVRERLRANRWRPDEILRRAFPIEPDELRKLLGVKEGEPVTLLATTLAGQRTVFVVRRVRTAMKTAEAGRQ